MKKIIFGAFGVGFVFVSAWLGYYFYSKNQSGDEVFETEKPTTTDIIEKAVATGSIVPRQEVEIKPQASGVIEDLYVEAGDIVHKGQLIAHVRVVQNLDGLNRDQIQINSARGDLDAAQVNYQNAERELQRQKQLFDQGVISEQEYNSFQLDYNVRRDALKAAEANLNLVRTGAVQRSGGVTNAIYSTVDGVVLDVPVKVGSSVIERNTMNEGTTVASIANMNTIVFEGQIDESEVGKLKVGMDLNLTIGALPDKVFKAKLEYISPKGTEEEGAIKFDIRAKLLLQEGDYLRAGYSANADIVLEKKDNILAVKESLLQFKGDTAYVEVLTSKTPQKFEERILETGISDGINIEVKKGLKKEEEVKVPKGNNPNTSG